MASPKQLFIFYICYSTFLSGSSIIIVDKGNPARFIRGSFMDENQPEIKDSSRSGNQFTIQEETPVSIQSLEENIIEQLTKYNAALTDSLIAEAKEITIRSAVNLCQFARTRASAVKIINDFQALTVRQQLNLLAGTNEKPASTIAETFEPVMTNTAACFLLMEQDLHQFEEAKHGSAPMVHLSAALKHFNTLQGIVSQLK